MYNLQRLGFDDTLSIVAPVFLALSGYTTGNLNTHVKTSRSFVVTVSNISYAKCVYIEPNLVQLALNYRKNKKKF